MTTFHENYDVFEELGKWVSIMKRYPDVTKKLYCFKFMLWVRVWGSFYISGGRLVWWSGVHTKLQRQSTLSRSLMSVMQMKRVSLLNIYSRILSNFLLRWWILIIVINLKFPFPFFSFLAISLFISHKKDWERGENLQKTKSREHCSTSQCLHRERNKVCRGFSSFIVDNFTTVSLS